MKGRVEWEVEGVRVEGLTGKAQQGAVGGSEGVLVETKEKSFVETVKFVANNRKTKAAQRGADLVRAARDRLGFDEGEIFGGIKIKATEKSLGKG